MKKINIQRDVESRKNIANQMPPVEKTKIPVERVTEEKDAQSEEIRTNEDNKVGKTGQAKKRGRTAKGDV
jgi:hypothetical protein